MLKEGKILKRTCEGCRAFDTDGRMVKCDLGYKQEKIYGGPWSPNSAKPAEECPKPRTYDEFFGLKENLERANA